MRVALLVCCVVLVAGHSFAETVKERLRRAQRGEAAPQPQTGLPQPTAIADLPQAKRAANNALARATLRSMSKAAEAYARKNNGAYPTSAQDLTEGKRPYLNTTYCGQTIAGYIYECFFSAETYKFSATPVQVGVTGTKAYTILPGGVFERPAAAG